MNRLVIAVKLPPYETKTLAWIVGVYSICAVIGALIVSTICGAAEPPGYALDSSAVFVLERALLASILLVAPAIVAGHLLSGELPSSIGRDGLTFRHEITGLSLEHQELLSGLQDELEILAGQIKAQ